MNAWNRKNFVAASAVLNGLSPDFLAFYKVRVFPFSLLFSPVYVRIKPAERQMRRHRSMGILLGN